MRLFDDAWNVAAGPCDRGGHGSRQCLALTGRHCTPLVVATGSKLIQLIIFVLIVVDLYLY